MSQAIPDDAVLVGDPYARDVARSAGGLLARLNAGEVVASAADDDGETSATVTGAGVAGLVASAADVHVARRLGRLGGCDDEAVLVAVALTVRATRLGSVCLEIGTLARLAVEDPTWPAPIEWRDRLLGSTLVREAADTGHTPLVLAGELLYLDRYWEQEGFLADEIRSRLIGGPAEPAGLTTSLDAYFPTVADGVDYGDQRPAAEAACRGWLTVVTGGPGTGKTTTVARLLGVLLEAEPDLRIALAAPTGRAAARMAEAVADATRRPDFPATHRDRIASLSASTLHRLLGWLPGRRGFRHHQANKLPYDVVVVDETSMVSLTLMSQLLAATRPHARLILVGDADQLASVDAGAVLGDLVRGLERVAPERITKLGPSRRFGPAIGALAAAIQEGDGDRVVGLLAGDIDPAPADAVAPHEQGVGRIELVTDRAVVDEIVLAHARELRAAAAIGDPQQALAALDRHRLLCAHREGPAGAGHWNRRVERALADAQGVPGGLGPWYPGRPVIVTENDYGLRLYNGDIGAVVLESSSDGDGDGDDDPAATARTHTLVAHIADGSPTGSRHAVARLSEVQSAHAMTVHRSQGSQVQEVTVLLPEDDSQLLTRQLLYTAVTRATSLVRVVGSAAAVRAAVSHQALRASGLADRLAPPTD